jgi:pimeloyl-ACP methyl ester carboxylesterase/DNA-binding CsgD family transcriptional regulator
MAAPVSYVQRDGVSIAYQLVGDEPLDLLVIPGALSHLALEWDEPRWRRWCDRMCSFVRLIRFDKRGTGLSDRPPGPYTQEERMEDARAVMDAVGVERAHVLATSEGGPLALLLAVTYPDRVQSLVLFGSQACFHRAPDYPWGRDEGAQREWVDRIHSNWGRRAFAELWAPMGDETFAEWWAGYQRAGASPAAAAILFETSFKADARPLLGSIKAPTLVLNRIGDRAVEVEAGRHMAQRIPGARFVELAGDDHVMWVGDVEAPCAEIEIFLTGYKSRRRNFWPSGLTDREVEILRLLAGGRTKKQISEELFISPRTTHAHVANIYRKIGAQTRASAAVYAIEHGLARANLALQKWTQQSIDP